MRRGRGGGWPGSARAGGWAVLLALGAMAAGGAFLCPSPAVAYTSDDHAEAFGEIPPEFVVPYGPKVYGACLDCHDGEGLLAEGAPDTGFRNGAANLHRRHVVEPRKGRNCRSCHATDDESRQDHLMRDQVPFGTGGWMLPVQFFDNADGGHCVVGCHQARTYDRSSAIPGEESGTPAQGGAGGKAETARSSADRRNLPSGGESASPGFGTLKIETTPAKVAFSVFSDDEFQFSGETPFHGRDLREGRYDICFEKEGYSLFWRTVTIGEHTPPVTVGLRSAGHAGDVPSCVEEYRKAQSDEREEDLEEAAKARREVERKWEEAKNIECVIKTRFKKDAVLPNGSIGATLIRFRVCTNKRTGMVTEEELGP